MRTKLFEKLKAFAMSSTMAFLMKLMLLHHLLEIGMSVPSGKILTQSFSGNIECHPGSGNFVLRGGAPLPCKEHGVSYCNTLVEKEDVQFCLTTCCREAKKPDAVGPSDKPDSDDSDANRWDEITFKRPTNSSGPTPFERGNI